ncbi:MAG: glycosyltransferase [Rhodocyclaceae bacterium]|jgi:glycosyltransferase involved in cell wall biosynthesis|nr:glycosyltransferase [Rhodocyclaceae bacterium]
MIVLHTESSLGWGGQENRTFNEMLGLRERGHTALLACPPGARLGARAREAGFTVFETPMRSAVDLPAMLRLRRFMAEQRPDVVNTHSSRDTQLAGMAARLLARRPRLVRTRHLALPITSKFTYRVLPDHVVTVSRHVENALVRAGVPREHITTVHTGIDFSRYDRALVKGDLREALGLPADTLLIGTVAILRRKKGHAELLEAVPAVLERFPDAHFVFAGDGPQHANIERRIAALQLSEHVHLLGLRRDVVNVLASLDLFVLPTHQEALGTAFVEAGAMGLACIGTNVDGVPEVINDGETGLLVPVHDPAALAQAIIALLADPARRRAMGEAASRHVRQKFSREAMVGGMVAVYERLLGQR